MKRPRHWLDRDSRTYEGELDLTLFSAAMALVSLGIVLAISATARANLEGMVVPSQVLQHVAHVALGLVVFLIMLRIPSSVLQRTYAMLVVICIFLILLVLAFGESKFGAKRWLRIGPLSFQPSEFLKVVFGLYLAGYLSQRYTLLNDMKTGIVPLGVAYVFFAAMLAAQPDVGSVMLLGMLVVFMLLTGGTRLTRLGLLFAALVAGFVVLVIISPEKLARVVGWLLPEETRAGDGYQIYNARIAIAAGGIFGVGLGQGLYHTLGFLPQSDTDFIFAVCAEELGLAGVCGLVLFYAVFTLRGLSIAARCRDDFSRFAAFAMTLLLTLPALVHMAVCLGLFPTKGLVLPFVSYGGSAMVASFATLGILQRLHLEATARPIGVEV